MRGATHDPQRGVLDRIVQDLVGCSWGRDVWTGDDPSLCDRQAARDVVLHDGDDQWLVRVCAHHFALLQDATDPHDDRTEA